ncbi:MAG TPA: hypothetical protein PKJ08_00255 [Candidatus Cloacimonadota bacterium]|nr:hypothetical protein [Candidatus Cloacimonadota bacterium]
MKRKKIIDLKEQREALFVKLVKHLKEMNLMDDEIDQMLFQYEKISMQLLELYFQTIDEIKSSI